MLLYLAQATQTAAPSQWASDIVYVLGAVGTLIGVVLGAFALYRSSVANNRATSADVKADINSQRITNTSQHTQRVDDRLTDVAFKAGQAAGTGNGGPLPGGIVGGNIDRPKGT